MGKIPSMAVGGSTDHISAFDPFFLGAPRLVKYIENSLHGNYILSSRLRIHMCKHSIWNTLRCYDTGYWWACQDQYISFRSSNDRNRNHQYRNSATDQQAWKQQCKERLSVCCNYLRMHLCCMSFLLFCKDKRAGDNSGERKNLH